MWQSVSRLLSEYWGETYTITEKEELPGGDIHRARKVSNGEKEVFIKYDTRDILPIFTAESDQLAMLAKSHTVRVPEVYGVGYDRDNSFFTVAVPSSETVRCPSCLLSGSAVGETPSMERSASVWSRF
ncbi:Fructosamine-3-kinase [Budvicia aquatica]|uniref:Fructosamine-3-kinase n=1 Tax=Budvicia aquatica TaxID=82979 RepID=A0A484ZUY3_9GAMM|nr:Fructosamine-3-kinase [Budvicia aquatica]